VDHVVLISLAELDVLDDMSLKQGHAVRLDDPPQVPLEAAAVDLERGHPRALGRAYLVAILERVGMPPAGEEAETVLQVVLLAQIIAEAEEHPEVVGRELDRRLAHLVGRDR